MTTRKPRSVLNFKDRTKVLNWCTAKKDDLKKMSKSEAVVAINKATELEISTTGLTEIAEMLEFKFVIKRFSCSPGSGADNHTRDAFLAKMIRKLIAEFSAETITEEEKKGLNSMIARTFGKDTE